jgi:arylsulfatase A-like enzyme
MELNIKRIVPFGLAITACFNLNALTTDHNVKPNVILILTDDQGSIDLNCYGAKDLKTPNLDRLAQTGIRFSQFYSGSSVCSPSRACLLTGKTPQGADLTANAPSTKGLAGMPTEQVTIAEILKTAGYKTGHIGKWHIGYSPETMPLGQGFDYSFGHMGGCIDNYSHFFYWDGPNRHDLWENGEEVFEDGLYFPDLMVEKASEYIKNNQNNPFFLYLAFNTPHYPLQPTQKWREFYKDLPSPRREYAGFVSSADERIGKIIDLLDNLKMRENTLIVFLSDQGHSYEDRTGGSGGNSGPYRGGKFSLFEGGIRVPAIFNWKGVIPEGVVNNEICMSMDILPTIADFCGVKEVPTEVEGKSIKSVIFENQASVHKVSYWQLGKQWAVRAGDWKMVGNPVDPSTSKNNLHFPMDNIFLSNLKSNISESINLAEQYPEKVKEMIELYQEWKYAKEEYITH